MSILQRILIKLQQRVGKRIALGKTSLWEEARLLTAFTQENKISLDKDVPDDTVSLVAYLLQRDPDYTGPGGLCGVQCKGRYYSALTGEVTKDVNRKTTFFLCDCKS